MQAIVRKYGVWYLSDQVIPGSAHGKLVRLPDFRGPAGHDVDRKVCRPATRRSRSGRIGQDLRGALRGRRDGVFSDGFTYSGDPVSAAIAVEAMRIDLEMDFPKVADDARSAPRGEAARPRQPSDGGNVRAGGFLGGVELMAEGREDSLRGSKVGADERVSRARPIVRNSATASPSARLDHDGRGSRHIGRNVARTSIKSTRDRLPARRRGARIT